MTFVCLTAGSRQLQVNDAQQDPATPISAMKAALRPGSSNASLFPPLTHALDSGSLSQPLLYGKSADGGLSEAGDKSSLPKAPVVPELAELFAILAWWLRLQAATAVAHPSWVEALTNVCRLALLPKDRTKDKNLQSPVEITGFRDWSITMTP